MRKHYLDNIRWGTILLVVLYHVLYMFNGVMTDGVVGSVTDFHGQDVLQYILYPWFMVILFIVSGMCSRYYLEQHSVREFFRARTRKLLVPSTIGLFVLGWGRDILIWHSVGHLRSFRIRFQYLFCIRLW